MALMKKDTEKELINLRVDDLPLLYAVIKQLKIGETLNQYLSVHGNWTGTLPGQIIELWLCYMLSTSDHKLSTVEEWSENHLELLKVMSELPELSAQDFADDKLGLLLDYVSEQSKWDSIERDVNSSILEVYRLEPTDEPPVVRLDAASFQTYGQIAADGLLQYGHSKHHPNLGQFKGKFGVLDNVMNNFSLPLCHLTVSGNQSDDGLYIPIIAASKRTFAGIAGYERGNLYVGDNKFGSIGNRVYVVRGGDYYLMPLSLVQLSKAERTRLIEASDSETYHQVTKEQKEEQILVAEGFEVLQDLEHGTGESLVSWTERRLFVRSLSYATSQSANLENKLSTAIEAIEQLTVRQKGKVVLKDKASYHQAIDKMLKIKGVEGLLRVEIVGEKTEKRIRAYGKRPARVEVNWTFKVSCQRNEEAIEQAKLLHGWQVYATNVGAEKLSFEKCVWKYRYQSNIESRFNDLRNKIVPLLPVYLQKDNRIKGLVNLLLLALKVCSVIEYEVAKALKEEGEELKNVYEGNPKRGTATPSASRILKAFKFISISLIFSQKDIDFALMTKLEPVQKRILKLLDLEPEIYTELPRKIQMFLSKNELTET